MRTKIVRLGEDRGVRIPRRLLDAAGIESDVDIVCRGESLVLTRAGEPREGWSERFAEMAREGDDELLDADVPTEWDETEWTW